MKPHAFGSSKAAATGVAALLRSRHSHSRDHRRLACNPLSRRIDPSGHAKRRHPPARKNTIPITPPRKSRRAFVQSGFNEVPGSRNPSIARRGDLTEASRFPNHLFGDSWVAGFWKPCSQILNARGEGEQPPPFDHDGGGRAKLSALIRLNLCFAVGKTCGEGRSPLLAIILLSIS